MGGGSGRGLDFGATYGSGELPLSYSILRDKPPRHDRRDLQIDQLNKTDARTLGGAIGNSTYNCQSTVPFQCYIFINSELANAYKVLCPGTGVSYRLLENSWICFVRNIAGEHAPKNLAHSVEEELRRAYGNSTECWTLREGVGTLLVDGCPTNVTIRWYEAPGSLRVGFIIVGPI